MIRSLFILCLLALLTTSPTLASPADEKRSDGEIAVAEGKEFKLNKDTITLAKDLAADGRRTCTVKAAAVPTSVKMKAQKWLLGFYPVAAQKDRVEIASVVETGPLQSMRAAPKMPREPGGWQADPGDIITHVNGYAVKTVEDVICSVHAAEDPTDIQLILKDVNDGTLYVFYVSAVKK